MNAGFAMNPAWPVSVLAMSRVKMDCKSPSHPAGMPSSLSRASARHPVVPNFSIREKQERVTASSFFLANNFHCLIKTHGFQQIFRSPFPAGNGTVGKYGRLISYIIILYLINRQYTSSMGISMNSIPQRRLASR